MRTKYRSNECAHILSRDEASHNWSAVDVEDSPPYRLEELQEALDQLVESGHVEQKRDANGDPVFRPDREGVLKPVWVSTGKPLIDDRDCYVEFRMETHDMEGRQTVVDLKAEATDDPGQGDFFASDISEAFNPLPDPVSGFAYGFRFILPEQFDGSEPLFERFRRFGLDPLEVAMACRSHRSRR